MNELVPLTWYLIVAAALFCIGLYGLMGRRNAVAMLMSVELMLNAVNINLIAFWRYNLPNNPNNATGLAWAIFILTVAAAEAAVGLALVISVYRNRDSVVAEDLDSLKN
jgi:NADH-quinone oxidoreductase subunit K